MSLTTGENALHFATAIDNSGLQKGTQQAQGILRNFTANISKMDVFAGLALGGVVALEKLATSAFDASKKYQTSMLEIQTISKATQEDFEGMSDAILKVGLDVPQTADELAKAFYQIASAGYDGEEGLTLLDISARAAVGGITDVETAADGVTTAMNAWRISTEGAEGITDKLFQTVKLGKTTFPELSTNLSQVASIAASAGISLDEVLAAVATLTKQGVPTAQAFTQIKSAIISTNEVLGDGWTKTMSFQEGMVAVADAAGGSQTVLKDMVGRVEAMNAVLALTGENAQMAADDLDAIKDSAGAAGQAFDTMVQSADNQAKLLAANIEAAFKPLGDYLVKNFTEVTSFINKAFKSGDIEKFAKGVGVAVSALVAYKTATALASISIMDLKRALVIARKAMQSLNLVSKANPWGLIAAGIVAATTAFIVFRKEADKSEKSLLNVSKAGTVFNKNLASTKQKSEVLFTALKNTTKGTEDRKRAILAVNKEYGKYLPHLLTENSSLQDIEQAQRAVNDELLRNVAIKSKAQELTTIAEKQIAVEKELYGLRARLLQENSTNTDEAITQLKKVAQSMVELGQTSGAEIKQMGQNLSAMYGINDASSAAVTDLLKKYVDLYKEVNSSTEAVNDFYDNLVKSTTVTKSKEVETKQKGTGEKSPDRQAEKELKARKAIVTVIDDQIHVQDIYTDAVERTERSLKDTLKLQDWEKVGGDIMYAADSLSLMADSIGTVNEGLGDTLGQIADVAMNVGQMVQGIASGNYLQAAVGAVKLITSLFNGEKARQKREERTTKEIERQNKELEAQLKILEKAKGIDSLKAYQNTLDEISQSLQELDKKSKETTTNFWGKTSAKYDSTELMKQYEELLDKQEEIRNAMWEDVTGTTSETLTDEILQGFENGKIAAEDFAGTFEDLMKDAMMQSFKTKYLEKQFDEFYKSFAAAAESGGALTQEEINTLQKEFDSNLQVAEQGFQEFNKLFESTFGTSLSTPAQQTQGMAGEIKASLTEETGTVLAGTLNSIRLYVAEQLDVITDTIEYLQTIASNTQYNKELERLENIENLLSQQNESLRSSGV